MGRKRPVSEIEGDLRSTAENISVDAGRLQAMEAVKAELPADDPRLVKIAAHAKKLADEISAKAGVELALAEEAAATS